jgi:apolipoprotein N-acyltransferase
MRQVQVVVGSLSILFGLLTYFAHPSFIIWNIFVWSGLLFAWLSWTCFLASVLAKLPCNK